MCRQYFCQRYCRSSSCDFWFSGAPSNSFLDRALAAIYIYISQKHYLGAWLICSNCTPLLFFSRYSSQVYFASLVWSWEEEVAVKWIQHFVLAFVFRYLFSPATYIIVRSQAMSPLMLRFRRWSGPLLFRTLRGPLRVVYIYLQIFIRCICLYRCLGKKGAHKQFAELYIYI